MRLLMLGLVILSASGISAQTMDWRVDQRISSSWGYEYNPDLPEGWSYHTTTLEETIHYLQDYPGVVDQITGRKKQTGFGNDGLWHDIQPTFCNPVVTFDASGKTISYDSPSGGYNYQRQEHYDPQGILISLNRCVVNTGYLNGHHYDFFYGAGGRIDSLITRDYSFSTQNWEKRIMGYDESGHKCAEIVYSSSDSLNWQPLKRAIIYQSGDDYPPNFRMQFQHMLFDLRPESYTPTVLYNWIPGLTDCGIVDSLITEVYSNGAWGTDTIDDYNVYTNTDGSFGFTIYSVDPEYIGLIGYYPSCWKLSFDSLGHYRKHIFSSEEAPSSSGTSYHWTTYSDLDDPQLIPIPDIEIRAWPNPFSQSISLRVTGADRKSETYIEIYNLKGQKIWTSQGFATEQTWDGKDFSGRDAAPGLYFIKSNNAKGMAVRKVIKIPMNQ